MKENRTEKPHTYNNSHMKIKILLKELTSSSITAMVYSSEKDCMKIFENRIFFVEILSEACRGKKLQSSSPRKCKALLINSNFDKPFACNFQLLDAK